MALKGPASIRQPWPPRHSSSRPPLRLVPSPSCDGGSLIVHKLLLTTPLRPSVEQLRMTTSGSATKPPSPRSAFITRHWSASSHKAPGEETKAIKPQYLGNKPTRAHLAGHMTNATLPRLWAHPVVGPSLQLDASHSRLVRPKPNLSTRSSPVGHCENLVSENGCGWASTDGRPRMHHLCDLDQESQFPAICTLLFEKHPQRVNKHRPPQQCASHA